MNETTGQTKQELKGEILEIIFSYLPLILNDGDIAMFEAGGDSAVDEILAKVEEIYETNTAQCFAIFRCIEHLAKSIKDPLTEPYRWIPRWVHPHLNHKTIAQLPKNLILWDPSEGAI